MIILAIILDHINPFLKWAIYVKFTVVTKKLTALAAIHKGRPAKIGIFRPPPRPF